MTLIDVLERGRLKAEVYTLLDKHHDQTPKEICKLMGIDHKHHGHTVRTYRLLWKRQWKNRQALKCLSFHNTRGWIFALKVMDREGAAVEGKGWIRTKARNKMLLWRDPLGRLEWFTNGRVNIWVRKPASWGRVKQLLANGFFGLLGDIQIFDLWANSARFKGAHLVYDTGGRLPYAKVDVLKKDLGVTVKMGDVSHPTSLEIEFCLPDFMEKSERMIDQASRALEINTKQIVQFSEFLRDLSQPKPLEPSKASYVS